MTSAPRPHGLVTALLLVTITVHALWAVSKPITCDDLFWGMAAGRYIVEHGSVPDRDVLSYSNASAPWINGEWLSQVIELALYQHGSGLAVACFKVALLLVVFSIVAWLSWRRTRSLALTAIVMVLTAHVCRPYFDLRSQLFLFFCTSLALAVIEAYRAGASAWVLALLPPIMTLWVNTHYSFLFGAGLLVLCAASELGKAWFGLPDDAMSRRRAFHLAVAAVVAILAVLVNPFGFEAVRHPFSIVGSDALWRRFIIEWVPPVLFKEEDFNPAVFGYVLLAEFAAGVATCLWMRRRVDVTDGLLFLSTAAMALSARRFVPIFALVGAACFARNLALLCDRFLRQWSQTLAGGTPAGMLLVAVLALGATARVVVDAIPIARMISARGLFDVLVGGDYFPAGAVEFLQRNPLTGRLFHPYTWGGYLSFHLPNQKIFIDGRAHTVYPFDFYREDQLAENGQPGWDAVLNRWQVALIVWPEIPAHGTRDTVALERFRAASEWVPIYSDGLSSIFAHAERGHEWIDAFRQGALVYPEVAGVQLFLAVSQWNANNLWEAHRRFEAVLLRFPEVKDATERAERSFLVAAQGEDSARAWFDLGFFRDVNSDYEGAAQAFSRAVQKGLSDPDRAAYARGALDRLTPR